jgi:hypothetical protein
VKGAFSFFIWAFGFAEIETMGDGTNSTSKALRIDWEASSLNKAKAVLSDSSPDAIDYFLRCGRVQGSTMLPHGYLLLADRSGTHDGSPRRLLAAASNNRSRELVAFMR